MGEHFAPPFWFVGAQETFDPTTIAVDTGVSDRRILQICSGLRADTLGGNHGICCDRFHQKPAINKSW